MAVNVLSFCIINGNQLHGNQRIDQAILSDEMGVFRK